MPIVGSCPVNPFLLITHWAVSSYLSHFRQPMSFEHSQGILGHCGKSASTPMRVVLAFMSNANILVLDISMKPFSVDETHEVIDGKEDSGREGGGRRDAGFGEHPPFRPAALCPPRVESSEGWGRGGTSNIMLQVSGSSDNRMEVRVSGKFLS